MKRILAVLLVLACLPEPEMLPERAKAAALTFDDGPSGRFTRQLLDGLKEQEIKATFLLCGYRMKEYPELTERIFREGHEIGIHGYSHDPMDTMGEETLRKELDETLALLPEGCRPAFLRPPGGKTGETVRKAAAERGLSLLLWSVDPRDWAVSDADAVTEHVLSHIRDGSIVLLHDMTRSSVDAALQIAGRLRAEGWRLLTVSGLLEYRAKQAGPGEIYRQIPPEKPDGNGKKVEKKRK